MKDEPQGIQKKMFELIADIKPTHVMDLPQVPDDAEARRNWRQMIVKLQGFLEKTLDRSAAPDRIEAALQAANRKNELMRRIFDYAARRPPVLHWTELYDVGFLALPATGEEMTPVLEGLIGRLEARVEAKDGALSWEDLWSKSAPCRKGRPLRLSR